MSASAARLLPYERLPTMRGEINSMLKRPQDRKYIIESRYSIRIYWVVWEWMGKERHRLVAKPCNLTPEQCIVYADRSNTRRQSIIIRTQAFLTHLLNCFHASLPLLQKGWRTKTETTTTATTTHFSDYAYIDTCTRSLTKALTESIPEAREWIYM